MKQRPRREDTIYRKSIFSAAGKGDSRYDVRIRGGRGVMEKRTRFIV